MRRLDFLLTVASQFSIAEIISHDQNDVGLVLARRNEGKQKQKREKNLYVTHELGNRFLGMLEFGRRDE